MYTVRIQCQGHIDRIIDDEGNAVAFGHSLQFLAKGYKGIKIQFLLAQLHDSNARLDGFFKLFRQGCFPQPLAIGNRIKQQIVLIYSQF